MDKVIRFADCTYEACISKAIHVLNNSGVVALPTDTLYGLVTTVPNAQKLYALKKRCQRKSLALFVDSVDMLEKYCQLTVDRKTLQLLLPGRVTLVFERAGSLPKDFNPHDRTVGIRLPDNEFVQLLVQRLGCPLAQSSANISGADGSPVCIEDFASLGSGIDLIIDGGVISNPTVDVDCSSTVIDLSIVGKYRIIRDGCVRLETIRKLESYGLTPS